MLGAVFQPHFIRGLTFSADFYKISIKDALATTSVLTQIQDCETSNGTAPVCALISRPLPFSDRSAANFPTSITVSPQNLTQTLVRGIDFEASYQMPLERIAPSLPGAINLRAFVTYLATYDTQASPTSPIVHRAGATVDAAIATGYPHWRATLQQGYSVGGLTVQFTERFTGTYRRYTTETFDPAIAVAPNRVYTDLFMSKRIDGFGGFEPFLQIDNLFNVSPPEQAQCCNPGFAYPTDKQFYDVLGRYFTIGAKLHF